MKLKSWAVIALVFVAIVWGAGFVLMKDAINDQPVFDFLATRFTVATIVMISIRPQVLSSINKKTLFRGSILGVMLGLAYITQTIGLDLTTAAITGFLTGLYVVFTPILVWFVFKKKVEKKVIVGTTLALTALLFISFNGISFDPGQVWLIACALLFAGHIIGLSFWSNAKDIYPLTVIQLGAGSVVCWMGAVPDGYQPPPNAFVWGTVVFTAVFATAMAFLIQTWAQSIMDPSRVAIILTGEIVFAAAIAVAVGQEVLSLRTVIGGVLIVLAMLIVEWPDKKSKSPLDQPHFT
ncbi:MAG: DMT family transporter [Rhodoluna sp.]|nr:DMT family transporter [Rhodoluna sp.]